MLAGHGQQSRLFRASTDKNDDETVHGETVNDETVHDETVNDETVHGETVLSRLPHGLSDPKLSQYILEHVIIKYSAYRKF